MKAKCSLFVYRYEKTDKILGEGTRKTYDIFIHLKFVQKILIKLCIAAYTILKLCAMDLLSSISLGTKELPEGNVSQNEGQRLKKFSCRMSNKHFKPAPHVTIKDSEKPSRKKNH